MQPDRVVREIDLLLTMDASEGEGPLGQVEQGAVFGVSFGWENPQYFAASDEEIEPGYAYRRANWFGPVGRECRALRENGGIIDTSPYAKYMVGGPGAEAWLDRIMSTRLPKAGRARLAVMLAPSGRLTGDLTLFNWGDGTWWIMGSYYLREWHLRWFHGHLDDGVSIRDLSDTVVGFGLAGPESRTSCNH